MTLEAETLHLFLFRTDYINRWKNMPWAAILNYAQNNMDQNKSKQITLVFNYYVKLELCKF